MEYRPSNGIRRVACAAGLLALLVSGCGQPPRRADVILIVVDTLRADRLGAYGYERPTSPHIDGLAKHSHLFRNASTPAPWTNPAMAAMFTGLAPDALGVAERAIKLPAELPTLAETLRAEGYATHGVVSNSYVGKDLGFGQGFDSWNDEHAGDQEYVSSPGVTDAALAILAKRDPNKPLFLFVHYFDPHSDYLEHEEFCFSGDFAGNKARREANLRALKEQASTRKFTPEETRLLLNSFIFDRPLATADTITPKDIQHLNDLYDSEVAFLDSHLGRLFAELERRGEYDKALIVLTADHGEALCDRPDHFIGHSSHLYQELLHVPLLIKTPGIRNQTVIEEVASTQDVLPTVVDFLRLPGQKTLRARSLLRELSGNPVFAATHHEDSLQAVRRGRWKLIHNPDTGKTMLFDLDEDPGETDDRSEHQPQIRAELEQLRHAWSERNALVRKTITVETPDFSAAEQERLRRLGYTHN
jgi:arylsulfatase A-like enzyme